MQKRLIAIAVASFAATAAHAEFNANIEFDNAYLNQGRGLSQSGRVELNAFGKAGSNYFVAGRASFLALKSGGTATDDMWVQVGSAAADIKLGRFEAADLFPLPRDAIVLFAGTGVYRANVLRGRFGNNNGAAGTPGAGQGVFHAAGTFNAGNGLSVELGVIEAKGSSLNNKGFRPVVTFASGPLTLKLGAEGIKYQGGGSETGIGFTGAYDIGGIKPILNVATGKDAAGNKQQTIGVIVDTAFGATVGYITGVTKQAGGDYETNTFYGAYTLPLFDIKGASMTLAGSVSEGKGTNTAPDEKGVKIRFNYAF